MKKLFLFTSFLALTLFAKTFAQSSLCPPITGLSVSNITNTNATFDWNAGPFNYNNAYDFYAVEFKPSNTNVWIWFGGGTPMHQVMSVFMPGTSYDIRVTGQYTYSVVSCSPSTVLTFTTTGSAPAPASYCTTKGQSTAYGWIKSVQIGGINNNSGNNNGYANFISLSTNVTGNAIIILKVQAAAKKKPLSQQWAVFVDLNNDGDFLDAGETVASFATVAGEISTHNIIIPTTVLGARRMRIKMQYFLYGPVASCGNFPFGEAEDYTLNFTSAANSRLAPQLPVALIKEDDDSQLKLTVYPNPAADYINVAYSGEQVKSLKVFDLAGRKMIEQIEFSRNKKLDISQLQKGMYVLQLSTKCGTKIQKFIKE